MSPKGVPLLPEESKRKLSESVKTHWIIRKQKYGSTGAKDPDDFRLKCSLHNKGKPVLKPGQSPWNKGLTKESDPRLQSMSEKISKWAKEKAIENWNKRLVKYGPSGHRKEITVWNKGMKGKYKIGPQSEEWRKKISEGHLRFHRENPGKGGWSGKRIPEKVRLKMRRSSAIRLAKQPRKNTKPELALAKILKSLKIKYKQQISIETCVPDFFIHPNICIFVDGIYWHNRPEIKKRDARVNQELSNLGYKVMRFWDNDIYERPQDIINQIGEGLGQG